MRQETSHRFQSRNTFLTKIKSTDSVFKRVTISVVKTSFELNVSINQSWLFTLIGLSIKT